MPLPILTVEGCRLAGEAIMRVDPALFVSENARAAVEFAQAWLGTDGPFRVTTSGSTGEPKLINLTRAQMYASAHATVKALGLRTGAKSLVCLPARYIAGLMMLARGLAFGFEMTLVEPSANPLADVPPGSTFNFAAFVPLQLHTILDGPPARRAPIRRARAILVGGASVTVELEQETRSLRAPVYHTYGMTETATHVALRRLNGPQSEAAFHALPGVELAQDARGCLLIRGAMTNHEWVKTNDVVEIVGEGAFRWLGRADNVINSGGVKVQVEPLEAALEPLLNSPTAGDARNQRFIVAGMPDERLGQQVTLILEGLPLGGAVEANLLDRFRTLLGPFEAPRRILYARRFVETPSGKIDRDSTLARI